MLNCGETTTYLFVLTTDLPSRVSRLEQPVANRNLTIVRVMPARVLVLLLHLLGRTEAYGYSSVLNKSLLFYEAQRLGWQCKA